MDRILQGIADQQRALNAKLAADAEEQRKKEQIEFAKKLITASYTSAQAYTNTIIIAAYAAFFTMWSFTRSAANVRLMVISAALMLISIIVFVVFEVVKMTITSTLIHRQIKAVESSDAIVKLRAIDEATSKGALRFGYYWIFTLVVTMATGLGAAAVMGFAFAQLLAQLW